MPQALSNVLGFPRIGPQRELKSATESYWSGDRSMEDLLGTAKELRAANWKLQRDAGIDLIPSNDFSLYDQVLDTVAMVGAVPARYDWDGGDVDLDTYFAMARGRQTGGVDVTAMEMTKWFDTNYHYIVPEFERGMTLPLSSRKPIDAVREAQALGIADQAGAGRARSPSCCWASARASEFDRLDAARRAGRGVRRGARRARRRPAPSGCSSTSRCWSRTARRDELDALERAYAKLAARRAARRSSLLATYFGDVGDSLDPALTRLPVAGLAPRSRARTASCSPARRLATGQDALRSASSTAATSGATTSSARSTLLDEPAQAARRRPRDRRAVVLAAARAARRDARAAARPRGARWLAFADAEARRGGGADARDRDGPRRGRDAARRERSGARGTARNSPRTRNPEVRARVAAVTDADAGARAPFADAPRGAARAPRPAAVPDHDDRLVPADRGGPRARAARLREGEIDEAEYQELHAAARSSASIRLQEEHRPRRARARRARAQRHGRVLRRAARRLRVHRATAGCRATARAA